MAAGVLVTTLDTTKRLPYRVLTFPMTAVSRTLQAGMRLQQNVAEMAIKGDEFFAPYCDQPEEQPAWATFDEDELPAAPPAPPAPPVAEKAPAPAKKAPARKAPEKKPAATKAPAPQAAAPEPTAEPAAQAPAPGRFALYSSTPADVDVEAPATAAPAKRKAGVAVPDIVEYLEYDQLTLAQLRAKLRGLSTDDLEALSAYETANRNRTPFVTMIDNRVASHQKRSGAQ